jgi:uncharacterized membrane protein
MVYHRIRDVWVENGPPRGLTPERKVREGQVPELLPNWHPVFVHFTVALYATSAALFFLGRAFAARPWSAACLNVAYWNLWLGAGLTVATVAAGFYAYFTVDHDVGAGLTVATVAAGFYAYYTVDHDAASHAAMADHRNWALATAAVWWVLALWAARDYAPNRAVRGPFLGALVLSVGLLTVTGWKGGDLVYRHGLGVLSAPQIAAEEADSSGRASDHGH